MSVKCPTCGGDGELEPAGRGWATPPGSGEPGADGETYRLEWHPRGGVTKRALFRVVTDDRVSILQHIRTVHVRQRGGESDCQLDATATVDEIPPALRAAMQADGYRPAESGEVVA
jgi:hypothetical protein